MTSNSAEIPIAHQQIEHNWESHGVSSDDTTGDGHMHEAPSDDFGRRVYAITDGNPEITIGHLADEAATRVRKYGDRFEHNVTLDGGVDPELDSRRQDYENYLTFKPNRHSERKTRTPDIIEKDAVVRSVLKALGHRKMLDRKGPGGRSHRPTEQISNDFATIEPANTIDKKSPPSNHSVSVVRRAKASDHSTQESDTKADTSISETLPTQAVLEELSGYFVKPNENEKLRDRFLADIAAAMLYYEKNPAEAIAYNAALHQIKIDKHGDEFETRLAKGPREDEL